MLAFNDDYKNKSGHKYLNPLCCKIYVLGELEDLLASQDFPREDPLNIEAHLWITPQKDIVNQLDC